MSKTRPASTRDDLVRELEATGAQVKGKEVRCPNASAHAHADRRRSASIYEKDGRWRVKCHRPGCGFGGDALDVRAWRTGKPVAEVVKECARDNGSPRRSAKSKLGRVAATYRYADEHGEHLFDVLRYEPKAFRQRAADGSWSLKGVRRVLYRLPDLIALPKDQGVFLVEGERDVDNLRERLGLAATTCPQGAGKWHLVDDSALEGRRVVILPDQDECGIAHAQAIADALIGRAASVKIITPDRLGIDWSGGDVSDLIERCGDADELTGMRQTLEALADETPEAQASGRSSSDDVAVIDPRDPLPAAREYIARHHSCQGRRTIHHHRGEFLAWTGTRYRGIEPAELRSSIYRFAERAVTICGGRDGETQQQPFRPTKAKVDALVDALAAAAVLSGDVEAPAWLDEKPGDAAPHGLLALQNGLLDLPSGRRIAHTPRLFIRHSLPFDYAPDAPEPAAWNAFLQDLWPDDPEAIRCMKQWFGYVLTPDTRQQKILLVVGPKRSGKGTIGRVLRALVGAENVAGPTLASLSQNFGLAALIGKQLAIISDARLSSRADQAVIAERLLSISGEDAITADRKYREPWTGRLPTRVMLMSNELPRLADSSGALASRFITLTLERSFYGEEDLGLTERLLGELPGIANWAIEGWRDLQAAGRFIEPASSAEAAEALEELSSPIAAFVRERCTVGPGREVEVQRLFDAWSGWCRAGGREHPGTIQSFGRDLKAAFPGVRTSRPRQAGGRSRTRWYEGISLCD